jgi:hypothetical protein
MFAELNAQSRAEYTALKRKKVPDGETDIHLSPDPDPGTPETGIATAFRLTVKKAIKSLGPDPVNAAITAELHNMNSYSVWSDLPPHIKPDTKPISAILFLKEKFNADGSFQKLKARLVADGSRQSSDTFSNITSPTIHYNTVLMLLSVAAARNMDIAVGDVQAAFLNAPLHDNIYIRLPPDISNIYITQFPDRASNLRHNNTVIVKLNKALYGTKQAARCWYTDISTKLATLQYVRSEVDDCLFIKHDNGKLSAIAIHVDDLIIVTDNKDEISYINNAISNFYNGFAFSTDDLSYLGMLITRDHSTKSISISQPGYINAILNKYQIDTISKVPSDATLFDINESPLLPPQDVHLYQSKIASLLYLATHSRPDILKEIIFLSTKNTKPSESDLCKLNKVFSYINHTKNLGIRLSPTSFDLHLYCDASFASHINGRSHTGIFVTFGTNGGPILVKSHIQSLTSLSSTESELIALVEGVQRCLPLLKILKELNLPAQHIYVQQDNMSAIAIASNIKSSKKAKFMRTRHNFLIELHADNIIKFQHCPTSKMIADILTKPMGGAIFKLQRNWLLNLPDDHA